MARRRTFTSPAGIRATFEVGGLEEAIAGVKRYEGRTAAVRLRSALRDISSRYVAPAIRQRTSMANRYGGHEGPNDPNPTKGKLRKKVTTRGLRTQGDKELAAVSVKPRQWWSHMVIQGTAPHEIKVRDKSTRTLRNPLGDLRVIQHPGARPVDYVGAASKDVDALVVNKLAQDIVRRK